jgi:hypothetical protein
VQRSQKAAPSEFTGDDDIRTKKLQLRKSIDREMNGIPLSEATWMPGRSLPGQSPLHRNWQVSPTRLPAPPLFHGRGYKNSKFIYTIPQLLKKRNAIWRDKISKECNAHFNLFEAESSVVPQNGLGYTAVPQNPAAHG